jgi:CO/xanthine dehydrogenase Mo-binding subunit
MRRSRSGTATAHALDLEPDDRLVARRDVALTLGIPKESVRLISPFIGGGFGGKLFIRADALLAALGARAARRPVKVALTRPMMFNNTTASPGDDPAHPDRRDA